MTYLVSRRIARAVFRWTMRVRRYGLATGARPGGYVLACNHASHLDPFCVSVLLPRKIGWMARIEFYEHPFSARLLRAFHAFAVNRQGVPVSAIRESLRRLDRGEVVGIFPEGEIKTGGDSVLRGAAIKRGVCLLAARSGCPVLPCVILGAEKLNSPGPWMPGWHGRLWIGCGDFIEPVIGPDRRAARAEMAAQIEAAMRRLYAEMSAEFGLDESVLP